MAQDYEKFFADLDKENATAQKGAPAADPTAPPPADPATTDSGTVGGFLADTGRALVGGVEAAGRGALQTGATVGNAVIRAATPSFLRDDVAQFPDVPQTPTMANEPHYAINKIVKDITQFGVGLVAGGGVMKAAGVGLAVGESVGKAALKLGAQSAIGTGIVADPHAQRASDAINELGEKFPFLQNPLTAYLASDPKDGAAEGKLKAVLEDAFTTTIGLGVFKGIQLGYRSSRGLLKGKELEQAQKEVGDALTTLNEAAETGAIKAEKYPENLVLPDKHLDLFKADPQLQHVGREEVNVKDLHLEHTLDEKGTESAFKYADQYRSNQDVADLVVKRDTDGKLQVMSGNARTVGAGQAGKEKVFADVFTDKPKSYKALTDDSKRLTDLETQVGGAKVLDKAAAKIEKANEAFDLTPEQYTEFTKKMQQNVIDGKTDELFVEGGAFNYSKMENKGHIHATLQSMAEVLAPALEKTVKSYQSFAEMEKTAALFGSKPEVMMANLKTWGVDAKNMPATLLAAKNWGQSLAADIFRDAQAIAITGAGGKSAEVEMMRKISVLADLEGMMKSVQTAAARTTAAGRIRTQARYSGEDMLKMLDEVGGSAKVSKLAEKLAATGGDAAAITGVARVSFLRKIGDTHNELWINALLSGPATHVVNIGTAGFNSFVKPGMIGLGGLLRGDVETAKTGFAVWRGLGSMYKDSFEMARRSFNMERPILSVTDKQLEAESTIGAANYNLNPESWMGQGVDWLGKAARIPSRFLGAEDEFFKQMSYRAKMQVGATQEGMTALKEGKITTDKLDEFIKEQFNKGFEYESIPEFAGRKQVAGETGDLRQTRATDAKGLQYANEATYTQSLKVPTWFGNRSFAETMYQAANSHPVLRGTILPFVKVPANLLREATNFTPGIALLRKQVVEDLAAGGERAAEAIGKQATGSLLMGSAVYLAVNGRITGAAPTDPDIRNRMYEKNWQPYSFVFGEGENKRYVPFARLDPFGTLFGIVGDIAQTYQHIDEGSRHSHAAAATMAVANLLNSRSYLKGIVDMVDVLSGGQGPDGLDKFERILNQRAASYIPNVVKLAVPDTEIKEIRSMTDALLAKTPYFSKLVEGKRGYFGDKVMAPMGWPWHSLLPVKPSTEVTDPGLLELARLSDGPAGASFGGPDKKVGHVDLTQFKNEKGQTAHDRMLELLNQSDFHAEVNDLVASPDYKQGTDGDSYYPGSRQTDLKKIERKYHREALQDILEEFPDLKDLVETDKENKRNASRGEEVSPILEFAK